MQDDNSVISMAISNLHIEAVRVGFAHKEEIPTHENIIKFALFTDSLEFYLPGKHKHLQTYRSLNEERRHRPKSSSANQARQHSPEPLIPTQIDAERFI